MKLLVSVFILSAFFSFGTCQKRSGYSQTQHSIDTNYIFARRSEDGIGKFYLGREISFVMGADGAAWLERNERQKEENTKLSIEKMQLSQGAIVADIGAGTGYFTFAIAKKITGGKIYAVEIQDEMIAYLNNRKTKSGFKNIYIVKGSLKSPNLRANSIDLAILVDVYHELEFPHEMLQAIKKSLKKDGKILLLEYRAEDTAIAIKPHHKMTIIQANKEMTANGFALDYDGEFLPIQHFLLYKKN